MCRLKLRFAICLVVASLVRVAPADDSDNPRRAETPTVESKALGKLPADFVVYAVGTYNGTKPVNAQLDDSGHEVRQAEVVVNLPKRNVVLVLTAYDPTVWRVGHTADTRIAGVLVSGYHGQALIGISKAVPHEIFTYEVKGKFPYFYAYKASEELLQMNETVKELVGKEIGKLVFKPSKDVFYVGDPPAEAKEIQYSDELTLKDYVKADRKPAGPNALEDLVKQGHLRLAKAEDIDAWVAKASEKFRRLNPDLKVEHYMRPGRTYVVIDECTLPNGLFGAHSRAFIIPQGVPIPSGSRGHNSFYLMDGTAQGPGHR
jgi:hypothetical protein